ncbi:MAG TPA: hypothetical protein VK458_05690, partial [Myxococcaceae bacterium]|nr:hypothetical protein [Myxococcaceae bacterium]
PESVFHMVRCTQLEIDLLRKCAEETLGDRFRPRRSKSDYVKDLQAAKITVQQLAVALQRVAGTWDSTTNAPPLIQWNESILGPLGMTEARQPRVVADAAELVDGLLLEALSDTHLDFVAAQVAPDFVHAAQAMGSEPSARRMALAQACLHGSDDELVKAVNGSISVAGPLNVDSGEPYIVVNWLVTPWGLLSVPHDPTEDAIAEILCGRGGSRLDAVLPEIVGASQLERCAVYVLQKGPSAAIDEFFSPAITWEFLQTKGLRLPTNADQHMLRGLLLQFVGLRPAPRPDGLLRQYSDLLHQDLHAVSAESSDAKSWRELRRFERHWESAACALIAAALEEFNLSIKEWLSSEGLRPLVDMQLLTHKQRPIRELTLGQKRRVLDQVFAAIERSSQCAQRLTAVGRAATEIRAAFCGEPMERLIAMRNELAHPKEEPAPSWTKIRSRLLDVLRPLAVPTAPGIVAIAPAVVRLVEERTDSTGWTRCEFETELGKPVIASLGGRSWAVRDFGTKNFHLVARNSPAIVGPILISI